MTRTFRRSAIESPRAMAPVVGGLLLGIGLAGLLGCATAPSSLQLVGPDDPFQPHTAACVFPETDAAFLLVDSLSVSNGVYRLSFVGRCGGLPIPSGRFGRPEAGSPNVAWIASNRTSRWLLSAAPVPVAGRGRTALVLSVELVVVPASGTRGPIELDARLDRATPYLAPVDAERDFPDSLEWRAGAAGPPPVRGPRTCAGPVLALRANARPGRPVRWRFLLAGTNDAARSLGAVARVRHESCLRTAARAWRDQRREAARLHLGDSRVESAVDDALLVLMGCTERRDSALVPLGNPFQYRDTWIRDVARQVSALAQWGAVRRARELADGLLSFQSDAGTFLSQPGQLDGTGEALWAMGEAYGRGPSARAPGRLLDAVVSARRGVERDRAGVARYAPEFRGLMPPANPRDNELVHGYLFGTDAWTHAGLRSAVELLRAADRAESADSVERTASELREAVRRRLAHEAFEEPPACWTAEARDWGNLAAAFPTGVLDARDPRMIRLFSRLRTNPDAVGLASYGSADSLHAYLGADLVIDALVADRPDLWRSAFEQLLRWRTGTGGAPEIFSLRARSFGANLPPHATSAAALLTTIRQALVCDALGDTLRLTEGTLPQWWDGEASLTGCGSRWGRFDLGFGRRADRVMWTWTPVPVWTTLALPPGARLADPPDPPLRAVDAHRVLAPPGLGQAEVRCVPN